MNRLREFFGADASGWQLAGRVLAFAFPVTALVVPKAASTIFAIFFLAGLWLLIRGRAGKLDPLLTWILVAFAAYFAVGALSFFLGEQTRLGEKLLGRDLRFLGAVAVVFALLRLQMPAGPLRNAIAFGGVATGSVALVQLLLAGMDRAGGETISIVFGHLSAWLFAANVGLVISAPAGRRLMLTGAAGALAAVLASQTRGALLVVALVLLSGLAIAVGRHAGLRRPRRLAAASFAAVVVIATVATPLWPRITAAWIEFERSEEVLSASVPAPVRGCLADAQLLQELLALGKTSRGLRASITATGEWPGVCAGDAAILLENPSARMASWRGPYRNIPAGTGGALYVAGTGRVGLEGGSERIDLVAARGKRIVLPAATDLEKTRLLVRVPPGEQLLIAPVEVHPGEYAFAAVESSVGNRLVMWQLALRRIGTAPLGQGAGSWPVIAAEEAAAGRSPWRLAAYDHAHSDYLTVLLERGWLGLLALFGVFVTPLAWAAHAQAAPWRRDAAVVVVVAAAVSALTETMFNHSIGITYYCFLLLLLAAGTGDAHSAGTGAVPAPEHTTKIQPR